MSTGRILLIGFLVFLGIFIILPIIIGLISDVEFGNVARIPITGIITAEGVSGFGQAGASSTEIVEFIKKAEENPQVKVIIFEINSPGGSAVASDEIGQAIRRSTKPTLAIIREVGASGGYWVASATDYIVANRMSITGSIGVISSYLEFSGLMEEYGVGYERLVAGDNKDIGIPFRQLNDEQRKLLQAKLDKIHDYFIEEIAANRNISKSKVRIAANGEFFLGVEALNLGLVDELGDMKVLENYLQKKYGLEEISYINYQAEKGLLDILSGVFADFSYHLGSGIASKLTPPLQTTLLV